MTKMDINELAKDFGDGLRDPEMEKQLDEFGEACKEFSAWCLNVDRRLDAIEKKMADLQKQTDPRLIEAIARNSRT